MPHSGPSIAKCDGCLAVFAKSSARYCASGEWWSGNRIASSPMLTGVSIDHMPTGYCHAGFGDDQCYSKALNSSVRRQSCHA